MTFTLKPLDFQKHRRDYIAYGPFGFRCFLFSGKGNFWSNSYDTRSHRGLDAAVVAANLFYLDAMKPFLKPVPGEGS